MGNFLLILDESPKIRRAPKDAEKWLGASAYQVPEQARMEWSSEQLLGRSCTHILWIWWEVTTP